MIKQRIFKIVCTKWAHFKFDAATGLKIVGTGACLPWCSISSSFQNSTEKNDSLNLLNFFKVSGRNQFILATFK